MPKPDVIVPIIKKSKKLSKEILKLLAKPEKEVLAKKGTAAAFKALVEDRIKQPKDLAKMAEKMGRSDLAKKLLTKSEYAIKKIRKAKGARRLRKIGGGVLGAGAIVAATIEPTEASDEDIENNLLEPIDSIQSKQPNTDIPHEVAQSPEQQTTAQKSEEFIDDLLNTPPSKQAMKCHMAVGVEAEKRTSITSKIMEKLGNMPGAFATITPMLPPSAHAQGLMDEISLKLGLFKGITSIAHYVPGYRSIMDYTKEHVNDFAKYLGVDPNEGVYDAGEFIGSMAPLGWMMSGAKWTVGAMRLRPDFVNRFIMTGAFGAAYRGLRGEIGTDKDVLSDIGGTALLFGAFEAKPIQAYKTLRKYMGKREQIFDKMIEKGLEQLDKLPGPRRIKLEKAAAEYGESWREWVQTGLSRLPRDIQKKLHYFERNTGIARKDASDLFNRIVMGKAPYKYLNPKQRKLLTRYYEHGWRTHKRPLGRVGERTAGEVFAERAKAAKVELPLEGLPEAEKRLIRLHAKDIRRTMFKYEKAGTEVGWKQVQDELKPLLNVHTFQRTVGSYLPKYREFIGKNDPELLHLMNYIVKSPLTGKDLTRKIETARMGMSRFLKQKGMPNKLRRAFEDITDAGELSYRAILEVSHDAELGRLFQAFHNDPRMSMTTKAFENLVKQGKIDIQKWVQLSPDKHSSYGMLADKVINRNLYRELQNYVDPVLHTDTLLRNAMSHWKAFKVVYRTSTHFRNMMTNVILNHLGGMSIFDPRSWWYYMRSADAIAGIDKELYNKFQNAGVLIGAYKKAELPALRAARLNESKGLLDFISRAAKKFGRKAGKLYEGEEYIAKGAKYLYNTKVKGMTSFAAADDAVKATFNYNDIPRAIKRFRTAPWGAPFITFQYKALPFVAKSVVTHPTRIGSLLALMAGVRYHSINELNITYKEWKSLQKKLPSYVKSGSYMPLPYRDKQGRIQLLDMTYIVPWGDLLTMRSDVMEKGPAGIGLGNLIFSNPLYATTYEILHNKDYSGKEIYKEWETPANKTLRIFNHIWQAAVPSILIGGYDFNKVKDALLAEGQPTPSKAPTLGQALASQVGLRTYARTKGQIIEQDIKRKQFVQSDIMKDLQQKLKKEPARGKRYTQRAMKRIEELWSVED